MTTERHAWISTLDDADERHVHLEVCRCGQDLDLCSRSHCPRCGASIVREPAHV
jgi:hypothetical protein